MLDDGWICARRKVLSLESKTRGLALSLGLKVWGFLVILRSGALDSVDSVVLGFKFTGFGLSGIKDDYIKPPTKTLNPEP